jgi:hypothetical protein
MNWKYLLLIFVVFTILTWATARFETPNDGNDTVGFPLHFYFKISGESYPCPENPIKKNYFYLLVDIAFAALLALGIWKLYLKFKSRI